VRLITQVRERSSPTWKGMRISSAVQALTCMTSRLDAISRSAASPVVTRPA
jgi:hypothetical protein